MSKPPTPTGVYIGRCRHCDAIRALAADVPEARMYKFTGQAVADMIESGLIVSRAPWGTIAQLSSCTCGTVPETVQEALL